MLLHYLSTLIINLKIKIMARKHQMDEVLRSLGKKHDCKIKGKDIFILKGKTSKKQNDLGNGSWGKISYLVNYCGFSLYSVSAF